MAATTASASLPSTAEVGREVYDPVGAYAFADSREARHYPDLAAQAHEVRQQSWEGRGTVRTARAGTRFRLSQGYLDTSDLRTPASTICPLWVEHDAHPVGPAVVGQGDGG